MQGRGKEIFLLVLALGALGLALYTFRGKPASAPAPPAPGAPAAEEAGEEVEEAPDEGTAATEGAERASAAGTDPFSLPGAASGTGLVGTGGTGEAGEGGTTQVPVEPPPGETELPPIQTGLKLEGIVTGQPTFAVIRHEGKPYFVKVGDSVADTYRVEAIRGGREVVLAGQQGTVVLRTGKSS
jgi:hypothetical protein